MAQLTPEQMVMPKAFAPFEVAECFARWSQMARDDADAYAPGRELDLADEEAAMTWANGLGPPCPVGKETNREFGQRCAVALFTLIKEI